MRNLQKILALVLALVMSFSLVTTAGAAFSDEGDITESYQDAIKVLNGLEVFKGYDNGATFQPKGSITRAEVAAIIYRIATGDVTDAQKDIYSSYGQFNDVLDGSWYAGYVNYCANAGYIKGRGNKTFDPQGQVTGYEALAMILRAIGYDKNNEFTGSNWQVRTASTAKERHITDKITATQLGQAATREVVAEILFQSILVNKVNFSANTLSYTQDTTSLGKSVLGLEKIEGVVVANEYADLDEDEVLADGKTQMIVDGKDYNLDYSSELTDIGESRYAYVTGSKVLHLGDTGKNKVFEPENGKGVDISTDKKFETVSGLKKDGTDFYINFDPSEDWKSDWRIRYEVHGSRDGVTTYVSEDEAVKDAENFVKMLKNKWSLIVDASDITRSNVRRVTVNNTVRYILSYGVEFKIDARISPLHQNNIEEIFNYADKFNDEIGDYSLGEVYVGTSSTKDVSDEMSYSQFKKEYIKEDNFDTNWGESDNGEWVKIVDNNGDGKADYAFLTEYWMDEATGTFTRNSESFFEYEYLNVEDYDDDNDGQVKYLDEISVGDVVYYSIIDKKVLINKAADATAKINSTSFRDETVTTTDGTTYGQSGIYNETDMDEVITEMDENVEYKMYMDKYGYVRAYELTSGTKYALVTEIYNTRDKNGQYVTSNDLTAEIKAGTAAAKEYDLLNSRSNEFVMENVTNKAGNTWYDLFNNTNNVIDNKYEAAQRASGVDHSIVLQPATNHLGLTGENGSAYFNPALTNVARYAVSGDGVRLTTAAEYAYNKNGDQLYYTNANRTEKTTVKDNHAPVYAFDYIELDNTKNVKDEARRFDAVNEYDNIYVNAVHDTEFYIVRQGTSGVNGTIRYFKDYVNLDAINAIDIDAIYAVARNTEADNLSSDYWVADVIVIEVNSDRYDFYDSISFVFDHTQQNSGRVVSLDTLNSKASSIEQTVIPTDETWSGWRVSDYGFYGLLDTRMDNGDLMADEIRVIDNHFNDYGIYAGTVNRIDRVKGNGGYIVIDGVDVDNAPVYGIDGDEAISLRLANTEEASNVKTGDRVIWVQPAGDEDDIGKDTAFIIDVTNHKYSDDDKRNYTTPDWLYRLWSTIYNSQKPDTPDVPDTYTVGVEFVMDDGTEVPAEAKFDGNTTTTSTANISLTIPTGYTVTGVKKNGVEMDADWTQTSVTVKDVTSNDITITVTLKKDSGSVNPDAPAIKIASPSITTPNGTVKLKSETVQAAIAKSYNTAADGSRSITVNMADIQAAMNEIDSKVVISKINVTNIVDQDGNKLCEDTSSDTSVVITLKADTTNVSMLIDLTFKYAGADTPDGGDGNDDNTGDTNTPEKPDDPNTPVDPDKPSDSTGIEDPDDFDNWLDGILGNETSRTARYARAGEEAGVKKYAYFYTEKENEILESNLVLKSVNLLSENGIQEIAETLAMQALAERFGLTYDANKIFWIIRTETNDDAEFFAVSIQAIITKRSTAPDAPVVTLVSDSTDPNLIDVDEPTVTKGEDGKYTVNASVKVAKDYELVQTGSDGQAVTYFVKGETAEDGSTTYTWNGEVTEDITVNLSTQAVAVEYTVTLETNREDTYSSDNKYEATTEKGTVTFTVKSQADKETKILTGTADVEGVEIGLDITTAKKDSAGFYTWTVTVSNVTADTTVTLAVSEADVQIKTTSDKITAVFADKNGNPVTTAPKVGTSLLSDCYIKVGVVDESLYKLPRLTRDNLSGFAEAGKDKASFDKNTSLFTIPKGSVMEDPLITITAEPDTASGIAKVTVSGRGASAEPDVVKIGEILPSIKINVGAGFTSVASTKDIVGVAGTIPYLTEANVERYIDSVSPDGTVTFHNLKVEGDVMITLSETAGNEKVEVVGGAEPETGSSNAGDTSEPTYMKVTGVKLGSGEEVKPVDGKFYISQNTALKGMVVTLSVPEATSDNVYKPVTPIECEVTSGKVTAFKCSTTVSGDTVTLTFDENILATLGEKLYIAVECKPVNKDAETVDPLTVTVDGRGAITTDAAKADKDHVKYLLVDKSTLKEGVDLKSLVAEWNTGMTAAEAKETLVSAGLNVETKDFAVAEDGEAKKQNDDATMESEIIAGNNRKGVVAGAVSLSKETIQEVDRNFVVIAITEKAVEAKEGSNADGNLASAGVSNPIALDYTIQEIDGKVNVKLLGEIEIGKDQTYPGDNPRSSSVIIDRDVVLDLNGFDLVAVNDKDLNMMGKFVFYVDGGNLTIKNSSKTAAGIYTNGVFNDGIRVAEGTAEPAKETATAKEGSLTIENITLDMLASGANTTITGDGDTGYGISTQGGGTDGNPLEITVKDSKINGVVGIYLGGNTKYAKLNVTGQSTVVGKGQYGIFQVSGGTGKKVEVIVGDGKNVTTIHGGDCGLLARGGEVTIKEGSVISCETNEPFSAKLESNNSDVCGAAVALMANRGAITANIEKGVTLKGQYEIVAYPQTNKDVTLTNNVTGNNGKGAYDGGKVYIVNSKNAGTTIDETALEEGKIGTGNKVESANASTLALIDPQEDEPEESVADVVSDDPSDNAPTGDEPGEDPANMV